MTRKVFQANNKDDVDLLLSILSEDVYKITQSDLQDGRSLMWYKGQEYPAAMYEIAIDWHDKTEITRPKNWESMIGCVGWFSSHKDAKKDDMIFGLLDEYNKNDNLGRCFYCHCDTWYKYFFPAKKCDVKFYGVDKDD